MEETEIVAALKELRLYFSNRVDKIIFRFDTLEKKIDNLQQCVNFVNRFV